MSPKRGSNIFSHLLLLAPPLHLLLLQPVAHKLLQDQSVVLLDKKGRLFKNIQNIWSKSLQEYETASNITWYRYTQNLVIFSRIFSIFLNVVREKRREPGFLVLIFPQPWEVVLNMHRTRLFPCTYIRPQGELGRYALLDLEAFGHCCCCVFSL